LASASRSRPARRLRGVFSNSLFAPLFHEDPRYYVMGTGHPFFKRLVYAGTRAIITRTDSGRTTPNFSLLAGNAAGSALTIPYYPAQNTSFKEVAETFGGRLAVPHSASSSTSSSSMH